MMGGLCTGAVYVGVASTQPALEALMASMSSERRARAMSPGTHCAPSQAPDRRVIPGRGTDSVFVLGRRGMGAFGSDCSPCSARRPPAAAADLLPSGVGVLGARRHSDEVGNGG